MKRNERIAHDLICIIKYGSIGGSVSANEISRLVSHMESTGLVQREVLAVKMPSVPRPAPPAIKAPSVTIKAPGFAATISLPPSIKLPGA